MTNISAHTVKAFDEDLERLRVRVAEAGGRAEAAVGSAIEALMTRDENAAAQVIADDKIIDALTVDIERQAVRLIALRAPMADDLREVLAALKISVAVERIGDNAKKIARCASPLGMNPGLTSPAILPTMARAVSLMIQSALDAYLARNPAGARLVSQADDEVDRYYHHLFGDLLEQMRNNPTMITTATSLIMVAQSLERIGDHAVHIADAICFAATGDRVLVRPTAPVAISK